MRYRSLVIYLLVLGLLCAAVITSARAFGRQGAYLAQFYMLTPAAAALITRSLFHEHRFKDAALRFGRLENNIKYWLFSLGIVAAYFAAYTAVGAATWDLTGGVFLRNLSEQFASAGQDMTAAVPPGFTPQTMLLVYFVGGLTLFNILPGLITGFGEEFGHRGLMFPLLYSMRPWVGFIIGGLIWFAWHLPLALVVPSVADSQTPTMSFINAVTLAIGAIFTHVYLAYVYVRSSSIFVVSLAHITLNNASAALGYFVALQDQLRANLATALVMMLVVGFLQARGHLRVFRDVLGPPSAAQTTLASEDRSRDHGNVA